MKRNESLTTPFGPPFLKPAKQSLNLTKNENPQAGEERRESVAEVYRVDEKHFGSLFSPGEQPKSGPRYNFTVKRMRLLQHGATL